MKISSKEQYAIKAMIDLAINFNNPVSITELSKSQTVSISYLEQIFSKLRRSGLIQGVRGPGGGYRLGKSPDQISIAAIILALKESTNNSGTNPHLHAKMDENNLSQSLWNEFSAELSDFLGSIFIADILKEEIVVKSQFSLDETTRRISTMFPVSSKLKAA